MRKRQRSHYWRNTPQRAARDAELQRSGRVLPGAQIAEQRRDAEIAWAAYRCRGESPEAYAVYKAAYREHWAKYGHTLSNIAVQVYLHGYDGKPFDVEPLIAYLERDFREPHSCHTKKKVVQYLEDLALPENLRARLQQVVLDAVDGRKHSEFNGYGGLAKVVSTPTFRGSLHDRLKSEHGSIRRRARIMLELLDTRADLPSREARQSASWTMKKKWQRLEHRWDTRRSVARDKQVAQAAAAQTEAQVAEQQRDSATLWAAYSRRLESPEAYAEYEETHRRLREKLGHSQADIAFGEVYQRMVDRKPVDTEPFIGYLERDAFDFGSGYAKARIIQFLKSVNLSETERARLRRVALHAVDSHDRREFRRYGGLARVVDAPDLRAALHDRLSRSSDAGIRRRAAWMLYAIGERSPELQEWQEKRISFFLAEYSARYGSQAALEVQKQE